ncbi:YggT family protein [Alishewanella sp. d11]|uniref:YggT family protein n=1 Tax=Alishewanella sp. d11 TaxID=3414030 RepID=UPI003BF7CD98
MEALNFLIHTVFTLYLMVMLLRFWLQLVRADFYNPFSQFIVKVTNPVVLPLRRVLPSLGKLDTATLLLAYLIATAKLIVLQFVFMPSVHIGHSFILGGLLLMKETLSLIFWVLLIRAIMSWFSQGRNPMEYVFQQLTEPFLAPIRRILPPMGGLDLSVLVALIALKFIEILLGGFFRGL